MYEIWSGGLKSSSGARVLCNSDMSAEQARKTGGRNVFGQLKNRWREEGPVEDAYQGLFRNMKVMLMV